MRHRRAGRSAVVFVRLEIIIETSSAATGARDDRSRADLNDQVQAYIDERRAARRSGAARSTTVLSEASGSSRRSGKERLRLRAETPVPARSRRRAAWVVERHQRFAEQVVEMCMIAASERSTALLEAELVPSRCTSRHRHPATVLALAGTWSAKAGGAPAPGLTR